MTDDHDAQRQSDRLQIAILVIACAFAICWPTVEGFAAQSQEVFNATTAEQMKGMVLRVERIETMINAVLLALVANFIAQIVRIRRTPERRR